MIDLDTQNESVMTLANDYWTKELGTLFPNRTKAVYVEKKMFEGGFAFATALVAKRKDYEISNLKEQVIELKKNLFAVSESLSRNKLWVNNMWIAQEIDELLKQVGYVAKESSQETTAVPSG